MKTTQTMLLLFALALTTAGTSAAQETGPAARERLVVSAQWLRQHAADPEMVLLHVGNRGGYDTGHIPGARFVDFSTTLATSGGENGLTLELPAADTLRERLAALGISDRSRVIVYQSSPSWTQSSRVMLTLDYAGLTNVSLLDGGQAAWVAAGGTLTTDVPAEKKGTLSPLKTRAAVVDAEFVKSHLHTPGFTIIDARLPAFYDGTRTGGAPNAEHKTGHIPGAVNVPFDSFTTPDAQLKPSSEIAAAFSRAGIKPGDTVITYCHIGQQATATLFAARLLGYNALLYDGSFEDWSRRNLPVETAVTRK